MSQLSHKIREAPDFPKSQVPVQIDRGFNAVDRIILAPLPAADADRDPASSSALDVAPRAVLTLKFTFEQTPGPLHIRKIAESLCRTTWLQEMPIKRIGWGGLSAWGPQPWTVLKAVGRFKRLLGRSYTAAKSANSKVSPGLQTPLSTSHEPSQSLTPERLSKPARKKRKTRR